ncbi:MAG: hypothetical protein ACO3IB_11830 [Phycisphaerales bacterium]
MLLPLACTLLLAPSVDAAKVSRMPDAAQLARIHELLASEPHVAGTAGDARTIERIAAEFRAMGEGVDGWSVEVHEIYPLLARPVRATLEIVGVDVATPPQAGARTGRASSG